MSKKILTIDMATGQEKLVQQVFQTDETTGLSDTQKQEVSYSVKSVDDTVATINQNIADLQTSVGSDLANQITTINNSIDTLEDHLNEQKNEASYQDSIKDKVADVAARDALVGVAEGDRYLVGNDIHEYHALVPAEGETPVVPAHWDVITALKGMQVVDITNNVEYYFNGTAWVDKLGDLDTAYKAAVATEKSRAEGVESSLQGLLTEETNRATDAETALQDAIDAENTRALAAEAAAQSAAETTAQNALTAKTHNSLQGLQGGTETERYHLDNATYTKVNALAADDQLVHKTGDESIAGNKTFSNDVVVTGNFTVSGTTTTVDTQNLTIKDNIITLNDSEPADHDGISLGKAGLEIDRGSAAKANLYFDETDDLFHAGTEGAEKVIARIDDVNSTSSETYSSSKIDSIKSDLNLAIINSSLVTFVSSTSITAGQIVYLLADGKIAVADNTNTAIGNSILGIAVDTVAVDGTCRVASTGKITGYSSLIIGAQVFVGVAGQIMQINETTPLDPAAKVLNCIGVASGTDSIVLGIAKSILL